MFIANLAPSRYKPDIVLEGWQEMAQNLQLREWGERLEALSYSMHGYAEKLVSFNSMPTFCQHIDTPPSSVRRNWSP
jgi:hypothetical protein